MIQLEPQQYGSLLPFVPDQPEATLPLFCLANGLGDAFVDDRATPRNVAVLVEGHGVGDPDKAFLYGNAGSDDLSRFLRELQEPTEVFCAPEIGELVFSVFPDTSPKQYVVYYFDRLAELDVDVSSDVRRLRTSDTAALSRLLPSWAWGAFESPRDMIMSGAVYGVVGGDEILSAAFLTDTSVKYETIAAVTTEGFRRRGHALACCRRLQKYSLDRGKLPRAMAAARHDAAMGLAGRLGFPAAVEVRSYFLDVF